MLETILFVVGVSFAAILAADTLVIIGILIGYALDRRRQ